MARATVPTVSAAGTPVLSAAGLTEVPGMTPAGAQTGGVAAAAVPVEGQATVVSAVVPVKTAPVVARVGDL